MRYYEIHSNFWICDLGARVGHLSKELVVEVRLQAIRYTREVHALWLAGHIVGYVRFFADCYEELLDHLLNMQLNQVGAILLSSHCTIGSCKIPDRTQKNPARLKNCCHYELKLCN